MIHIEKDQAIAENENIKVLSPTGDYNDTDLIEYYSVEEPEVAQGAYHAQFIKYGGIVYRFNDPKELGAEILKIEPESTHGAASLVRMQNELSKQFDQGSLEPESLNQLMESEQIKMEEEMTNTSEDIDSENLEVETDSSSDLDLDAQTSETATTTPIIGDMSSTTPPIIPDLVPSNPVDTASSTEATSTEQMIDNVLEDVIPELEATSTASEILSYAKKTIKKKITKKIKKKILG